MLTCRWASSSQGWPALSLTKNLEPPEESFKTTLIPPVPPLVVDSGRKTLDDFSHHDGRTDSDNATPWSTGKISSVHHDRFPPSSRPGPFWIEIEGGASSYLDTIPRHEVLLAAVVACGGAAVLRRGSGRCHVRRGLAASLRGMSCCLDSSCHDRRAHCAIAIVSPEGGPQLAMCADQPDVYLHQRSFAGRS